MTDNACKPDYNAQLQSLKDFQRKTVDHVFRRLYCDDDRVNRFLIADEVGLGKTLVARGVVAKAIERLWDKVRVDIVYICSNHSIARQNINRLDFVGDGDSAIAERMTLLPLHTKKLTNNRVNFVSFTPGTSFDLRSSSGLMKERALIYHMLRKGWGMGSEAPPKNLLQGDVKTTNWRRLLDEFPLEDIDSKLTNKFIQVMESKRIRERFLNLAAQFPRARRYRNVPQALRNERNQLIGQLRALLARSCVDALEPDIVILDEFQRFRNLLEDKDEVGRLAKAVFEYPGADVKVLLLSATPYKMYTMYHEQDKEDHYSDFLRTIRFLFDSDEKTAQFRGLLGEFRNIMLEPGNSRHAEEEKIRQSIEQSLRKVMVRTERLSTPASDVTKGLVTVAGPLQPEDLDKFSLLDNVARHLGVSDTVEYWKSAPYVLNVMDRDGYKIKKNLVEALERRPGCGLLETLEKQRHNMLSWKQISRYQSIDPANARLRGLISEVLDNGSWQLLWMAPSLPYYNPGRGPYSDLSLHDSTKTLVFSSWTVVPKAIAMLVSYEAERRMVEPGRSRFEYDRLRYRARLLDFKVTDGRTAGMNTFPLIYPCMTMAVGFDPLEEARQAIGQGSFADEAYILARAEAFLENLLSPLLEPFKQTEGVPDERWYWAALAMLDWTYYREAASSWLHMEDGDDAWWRMVRTIDDAEGHFYTHIQRFVDQFRQSRTMGRPPRDLVQVLAKAAVASPSVVALRSLVRLFGDRHELNLWPGLLAGAARIAMGFRSLFNLPETIVLLRGLRRSDDERYWERVLDYCVEGNLQSVMDEYLHVLRESLGLVNKPPDGAASQLSKEVHNALSLRTVNLDFDEIFPNGSGDGNPLERHSMRCRFALRFGDGRAEDQKTEVRKDLVRSAFNSPFRPFVLATTSIGQEGLDFHPYCHHIYHWNLPSNPVDLEQREGRINRYKGHAIRKNVAKRFGLTPIENTSRLEDLWATLFQLALRHREDGMNDLVPFWNYDIEGGYRVCRCVPTFPLSRDREQLEHLRKTLIFYRMVIGQPRQEDLVEYLCNKCGGHGTQGRMDCFRIDLSPR